VNFVEIERDFLGSYCVSISYADDDYNDWVEAKAVRCCTEYGVVAVFVLAVVVERRRWRLKASLTFTSACNEPVMEDRSCRAKMVDNLCLD
jgi:hypothetical protein